MILSPEYIQVICADSRAGYSQITTETRQGLASYHGGEPLKTYLRPLSAKEDPEKYNWRASVAVEGYDNYPKEICQHYVEGVFRTKQPYRETKTEDFDYYLEEEYAGWFRDKVIPMSLILPELFIGYTKPRTEAEPRTLADEQEMELYPYPVIIFPQYVKSYSQNHSGQLEWICLNQEKVNIVYDEQSVYTFNIATKEVTTEPHGFTRIPFDRFSYSDNYAVDAPAYCPVGHAMLYDVIIKSIAGLNYRSMLDEACYYHLNLKLVMPEGTAQELQKDGMGNTVVLKEVLPPEGGNPTRYLETPSMEIETLERIVYERTPRSIYRTARLRFSEQVNSESGIAKMVDLMPELALLKDLSSYWKRIDETILWMLVENDPRTQSVEEIKIEYPTTFNTRTLEQSIKLASDFVSATKDDSLPKSETGNRLIVTDIYNQFLPDMTDEEFETIENELIADQEEEETEEPAPIIIPPKLPVNGEKVEVE